jgi:hypothetical protein
MSIWHITDIEVSDDWQIASSPSAIRLWKVTESEFRVIEQGAYLPVLTGPTYSLIQNRFNSLLAELSDQVQIVPATIFDQAKGTENRDYLSLILLKMLTPETIETEPQDGRRIWICQGEIFVSDALKADIESISEHDLKFGLGFQWWGRGPS